MKAFKQKGVVAAVFGALALLSGCGSPESNSWNTSNSPGFNQPGFHQPGFNQPVIPGGSSGCYRADQPVPFTVNTAYLSGLQMCTPGTLHSGSYCTGMASMGGQGASPGYFTDSGVDGTVRMDIIPATTDWAPFQTNPTTGRPVYPTSGNARGSFALSPQTLYAYQTLHGGQTPCISAVVAVSTGFNAGQLYGTRIRVRLQSSVASSEDELFF